MLIRSAALVAALCLALVAPGALVGQAAAAGDGTRMSLGFDRDRPLVDGAEVLGTPRRSSGTVLTDGTARIARARGVTGRAARFPCSGCGRAIVEVPDRNSLDPRTDAFSFGASVRITASQGRGLMNVVQKGWYDEPGGQYKLQVDAGRPSCVVFGSTGRVTVSTTVDVADGQWHQVTCQREGADVLVLVDGAVVAHATGETGLIDSAGPVWVGGKAIGTGDPDQFHGRLDDVFVRIPR